MFVYLGRFEKNLNYGIIINQISNNKEKQNEKNNFVTIINPDD